MRTIVNLPEADIKAIKNLAKQEHISQAEAIRRAVKRYLRSRSAPDANSPAFGIWADGDDGLTYQKKLRSEWRT